MPRLARIVVPNIPYHDVFDVAGFVGEGSNEFWVRIGNLVNDSYGQPQPSGFFGLVKVIEVE